MNYEVTAKFLGPKDGNGYYVNVRNAHPKGNIGDAGVIRKFDTEQEAKEYTKAVNASGVDIFVPQRKEEPISMRHAGDEFVSNFINKNVYAQPINNDDSFLTQMGKNVTNTTRLVPEEGKSGTELLDAKMHNLCAVTMNPLAAGEAIKNGLNVYA